VPSPGWSPGCWQSSSGWRFEVEIRCQLNDLPPRGRYETRPQRGGRLAERWRLQRCAPLAATASLTAFLVTALSHQGEP